MPEAAAGKLAPAEPRVPTAVRGRKRSSGRARSKYSSSTITLEEVTILLPSTRMSYDPFEWRDLPRNAPS